MSMQDLYQEEIEALESVAVKFLVPVLYRFGPKLNLENADHLKSVFSTLVEAHWFYTDNLSFSQDEVSTK
jgi:hypothetical protein